MSIEWQSLLERYGDGVPVAPIAGGAPLVVTAEEDDSLRVSGKLWKDWLLRDDLEHAVALLEAGKLTRKSIDFPEQLRRHLGSSLKVQPGCSRTPNLVAVILQDLGYLRAA